MGRWDVPTAIERVRFVRGRRIQTERVDRARELRRGGSSVREIARRLRISKSAAHRYTKDVSWDAEPDQLEEDAVEQYEDESEGETEPVPEEKTWTPVELTCALLIYDAKYKLACETNDTILKKWAADRLSRVRKELRERAQRNSSPIRLRAPWE